jgi:hypothetical protein
MSFSEKSCFEDEYLDQQEERNTCRVLMCYTCGSLDYPLPSSFSCYRFKGQFRKFAFFPLPSGIMLPVLGNTQIC